MKEWEGLRIPELFERDATQRQSELCDGANCVPDGKLWDCINCLFSIDNLASFITWEEAQNQEGVR